MRLRALEIDGEPSITLELHPRVTVLAGLPPEARRRLLEVVGALVGGEVPDGVTGTLEAHGVVVDLTSAAVEALASGSSEAVVLRTSEIPAATVVQPAGDESARREATEWFAEVRSERERVEAELRRALAAARAAPPDAPTASRLAAAADAVAAAEVRRIDAEAALAGLEGHASVSARQAAEVDLRAARRQMEALEERLNRARSDIQAASPVDARPVTDALEALVALEGIEPEPVPEAVEIADALEDVRVRLERRITERSEALEHARQRVTQARTDLATTRAATSPLRLSPADAEALERLHDSVEKAERRAAGRFTSPMAKRRLESARQAEQTLLERFGLVSYGDYLIRSSPVSVDTDVHRRYSDAQLDLQFAEQHLDLVEHEVDDRDIVYLTEEIERLSARATELLGIDLGDRALAALRALITPESDPAPLVEKLAAAFRDVGADPQGTDVREAAREWLAAVTAAEARRAELEDAAVRIEEQLDAARRAEAQARTEVEALTDEPADNELAAASRTVAEARAAEASSRAELADAEAVAGAARDVDTEEVTVLRTELAEVQAVEREAEEQVTRLTPEPVDDTSAAEQHVAAVLGRARERDDGDPVPVLVDDDGPSLTEPVAGVVLTMLDQTADDVQIVVLSADATFVGWAQGLGDRAVVMGSPAAG